MPSWRAVDLMALTSTASGGNGVGMTRRATRRADDRHAVGADPASARPSDAADLQRISTLPDTKLSLADIERRRSHPVRWLFFLVGLLMAVIVPYGVGRSLALGHTQWLVTHMSAFSEQGIAFITWAVTVLAISAMGMAVVQPRIWAWRALFVVALAAEQFFAGACLLKLNFWYSTYVVYGPWAPMANAANLGILAAGLAGAVFAFLFVAILVVVPKSSPLNVLTHGWCAALMFSVIELLALAVVLLGGLLTAV